MIPSASTALFMANKLACRILISSISSTLLLAIAQAKALALISIAKASRFFSDSFLESARPVIGFLGSRITAAANTAPAKGPLPASSTPQIRCVIMEDKPIQLELLSLRYSDVVFHAYQ